MTERASPARKSRGRGDGQALCQSDTIAVSGIRRQRPSPLSRACARQLPQRGSHWHVGQLSSGRAKRDVSEAAVLRCLGQRQLDKERCPEAAGPVSEARAFAPYRASGVQLRVARLASGSPFGATATTAASGGNREELLGPRPAGCERQRSRRWEPQPGQCHCFAMTERASSLFCLLYLQKSGHQSRIITYVS